MKSLYYKRTLYGYIKLVSHYIAIKRRKERKKHQDDFTHYFENKIKICHRHK